MKKKIVEISFASLAQSVFDRAVHDGLWVDTFLKTEAHPEDPIVFRKEVLIPLPEEMGLLTLSLNQYEGVRTTECPFVARLYTKSCGDHLVVGTHDSIRRDFEKARSLTGPKQIISTDVRDIIIEKLSLCNSSPDMGRKRTKEFDSQREKIMEGARRLGFLLFLAKSGELFKSNTPAP